MDSIISVSQLNSYINFYLQESPVLADVYVTGEISNFSSNSSGHFYFKLKDYKSVVSCVMFAGANANLSFYPENGMKVLVHGKVSVYETAGLYQIIVNEMIPAGVGQLFLKFEQLKKRLEAEGLFDVDHKKPIPSYPERIAVVTSPTGAAVRDVINRIKNRYPLVRLYIVPTLVQGDSAAPQIVKALEYVNSEKLADTIILCRGGGSLEDLWPFNEESVARAVYESDIPVVTGIGHETDTTIADFAADLRASTPTAAAELSTPEVTAVFNQVQQADEYLYSAVRKIIDDYGNHLNIQNNLLEYCSPLNKLNIMRDKLSSSEKTLKHLISVGFNRTNARLDSYIDRLQALNPLDVFLRGYSIARSSEGSIIKSVSSVKQGDNISVQVSDGFIDCTADSTRR